MRIALRLTMFRAAVALSGAALAQQKITPLTPMSVRKASADPCYATELAKLVGEKTQGRVEIRVFPAPSSAISPKWSTASGSDRSRWAITTSPRLTASTGMWRSSCALRVPQSRARHEGDRRGDSPVMKEINQRLVEKGGMRIVANFYRGARQLTARYPVRSPKDMQGKKFAPCRPLWNSMIKGMGAIPDPVEISQRSCPRS